MPLFKAIACVLILAVLSLQPDERYWRFDDSRLSPAEYVQAEAANPWQAGTMPLADGQCARLHQGTLRLFTSCDEDASMLWQSPDDWTVAQAMPGDLNDNGLTDLALLVWRPFKPWPVDAFMPHGGRIAAHQDSRGQSCHVLLLEHRVDGRHVIAWGGSALYRPLTAIAVADLDGDGRQELAALETRYDAGASPADGLSVWQWNGFGFTLADRFNGSFRRLSLGHDDSGLPLLITD